MTQQQINDLRNTLANTYSTLDDFLKNKEDKTATEVQLVTAKLLNIVLDNVFELTEEDNDSNNS